jgi:GNAT superfamily N-acetyltransferase
METAERPDTCEYQLVMFLHGRPRNQWLRDEAMEVYLRKARHFVGVDEASPDDTLDIANVNVLEEWRRRGRFSTFLRAAENVSFSLGLTVFVENVINPVLAAMLERRGYRKTGFSDVLPCYYKRMR